MDEKKSSFDTYQPTDDTKTSELEPQPIDREADTIKNDTMNEKKSEFEI